MRHMMTSQKTVVQGLTGLDDCCRKLPPRLRRGNTGSVATAVNSEPRMNNSLTHRRLCSFACFVILVILTTCRTASAEPQEELASRLTPLIEGHRGQVAVSVLHLDTGIRFDYRSAHVMPTASLIKLPIMIEAYRQIAAGRLAADSTIVLQEQDKVPGSGILTKHFREGSRLTLRDAIQLMIAFSDNTATNLVIDQTGLAATTKTMVTLGCPETKLHSKVYRGSDTLFPERSQRYGLGSTTAADIISLLERLHKRELISPEYSDLMLQHLKDCEATDQMPRLLPDGVEIAHKSGAVSNARCDAGIIYSAGGPLAICTLTCENQDRRWSTDNAAELLNARIAKAVFDHFNPPDPTAPAAKTTLQQGDFGRQVEYLQRTLNARMNPSLQLSVDGDFGPATADAVVQFQTAHNITADGVVGPETWEQLSPILTQATPVPAPAIVNAATLAVERADERQGRPFVTCSAWAAQTIGAESAGRRIGGHNADASREIASTTKVMTAWLVLRYAQQHPDVLDERITFSRRADQTRGSTAGIAQGESLPVREALYGLLLPSGNDASVALAEHFGHRLAADNGADADGSADPLPLFVAAMNVAAAELEMTQTTFRNPHGLTHPEHRSTASDLLKLAQAALQLPDFRAYISTRQRGCTVTGAAGYRRHVMWRNTNRLLKIDGYQGVKTGTTPTAGACLISLSRRDEREVLLVTLGSASTESRYTDARNLFRWAWQQISAEEPHSRAQAP